MSDWDFSCELYKRRNKNNPKLSQNTFLCSDASGYKFTDWENHINSFWNHLKQFNSETFKNSYLRGQKSQKHVPIEKKRIAYVTIYLHNHEQHKCGLYFLRMRDWLKRGQEYGIINSKCSNSWISDNLRCDNKNLVCTQKGVNGDTKEEEAESMGTPGAEFHTFIEDKINNAQ